MTFRAPITEQTFNRHLLIDWQLSRQETDPCTTSFSQTVGEEKLVKGSYKSDGKFDKNRSITYFIPASPTSALTPYWELIIFLLIVNFKMLYYFTCRSLWFVTSAILATWCTSLIIHPNLLLSSCFPHLAPVHTYLELCYLLSLVH